jgi:hypothetical protein
MNKTSLIKQLLNDYYENRSDVKFDVNLKTKDLDADIYVINLTLTFGPEDGIFSRLRKKAESTMTKKFLTSVLNLKNKELKVITEFIEYYSTEYDILK